MASPIEDMIEEIEEYIDTCKPVAFSSSKISVNRDEIQSLLEELRTRTPEEIRQYRKIINNEKAIIANAEKKAANILAETQIKTDELVSEHLVMKQAYAEANQVMETASKKANEIIDKATAEANEMRMRAVSYTDGLLKSVQDVLVRSMDATKTKADAYLVELQGYLDVVMSNRMELSPSPEEVIINGAQPKVSVPRGTVAKSAQPTNTMRAEAKTAPGQKGTAQEPAKAPLHATGASNKTGDAAKTK